MSAVQQPARERDFIRIGGPQTPRERLMRMVAAVADEHGVEPREIMSGSRRKAPSRARQDCWARLRREGLSYPQIGRMFGRDHSTVVYGVQRWERGA